MKNLSIYKLLLFVVLLSGCNGSESDTTSFEEINAPINARTSQELAKL